MGARVSGRGALRSVVWIAPAAVTILLLVLTSPAVAAETTVFGSTGAEQSYVVPAGVTEMSFVAIGGGTPGGGYNLPSFGARVSGKLSVTPGETLYVEVGANGAGAIGMTGGLGGFNGGGNGGNSSGGYPAGLGGGGASDLRTVPRAQPGSLASRLLVAGGGGGGSGLFGGPYLGGRGGNAGGLGANGSGATGGGAGTQSGGGASGGGLATAGTAGQGGSGGAVGGGGGGGGYFGGGGGQGQASSQAGGGGGGSSFLGTRVTDGSVAIDDTKVPSITLTTIDAPPSPPSNAFTLGKLKSKHRGRASIEATFPGPGTALVQTDDDAPTRSAGLVKARSTQITAAGTLKLKIRASARAKGRLRAGHRVRAPFEVVYTPTGGTPATLAATVRFKP